MGTEESDGGAPASGTSAEELRAMAERLEKACHTLEILQERTNTLVRLLDLMGRRVDRLEFERSAGNQSESESV